MVGFLLFVIVICLLGSHKLDFSGCLLGLFRFAMILLVLAVGILALIYYTTPLTTP